MAEVQPLRALHYDLATAGPLQSLIAPPYDVIDADQRSELTSRSPYNVVHVDLPEGDDPYAGAGRLFEQWIARGVVVRDEEPALWAIEQAYDAPGGPRRIRKGFFCRTRLSDYGPGKVRPHERTHPAAKADRLQLMRATRANLSPVFALYADDGEVWSALATATGGEPWARADDDGTSNTIWRIGDEAVIERVTALLADKELLIADGHHRYETARTYAREVGGSGDHDYVLTCLVSMSDPGLAVFPTHRVLAGAEGEARARLERLLERDFTTTEVDAAEIEPEPGNGLPQYGFYDATSGRALRLELSSSEIAERALAEHSPSYRRLDTAVLEKLVLEDALGLSEDDISHQRGLGYARNVDQAMAMLREGPFELAFVLRPTPIAQVRDVAREGETMPPKSTYFFPKFPSGLLFNPL